MNGFTIGRDDVLRWVDRHDAAWRAADPAAIAELFSPDAVYHVEPWDAPWRGLDGPFRGRDTIATGWLAGGIEGERSSADTEILAMKAARRGVPPLITYFDTDGSVEAGTTLLGRRLRRRRPLPRYQEWFVDGS